MGSAGEKNMKTAYFDPTISVYSGGKERNTCIAHTHTRTHTHTHWHSHTKARVL